VRGRREEVRLLPLRSARVGAARVGVACREEGRAGAAGAGMRLVCRGRSTGRAALATRCRRWRRQWNCWARRSSLNPEFAAPTPDPQPRNPPERDAQQHLPAHAAVPLVALKRAGEETLNPKLHPES
jgi:hypothetical protein